MYYNGRFYKVNDIEYPTYAYKSNLYGFATWGESGSIEPQKVNGGKNYLKD